MNTTPTPASSALLPQLTPELASKTPVWKISPGGVDRFINSVAVSADGSKVVGGTFYHKYSGAESRRGPVPSGGPVTPSPNTGTFGTYCYNTAGTLLWKNEFTGWQGVYWVAVSADGTKAASGGLMTQSPQAGFVRAFDATAGTLLLDYPTLLRVNQVALSGDGTWLVSAAETLVLFKFDSTTAQYAKAAEFTPTTSPGLGSDSNGVVSVGLSLDGTTIVFADYAGHLGVLSNANGTLTLLKQWKLPGDKGSDFCHMVDLTPDGKAFAAGGSLGVFYQCNTAQFVAEGRPTCTYSTSLPEAVYGVAISADGSVFAGVVNAGQAGRAYVVSVVDNAPQMTTLFTLQRNPNSASLNLAHGLFAVADGHPDGTPGHFYLYSQVIGPGVPIVGPILRWIYQTGNMSWPVVISANGNAVVGGSDDTYIYYFIP